MVVNFELRIFRFDAKTDYLPYFKKYTIDIDKDQTLVELLKGIQEQDVFFDYPKGKNSYVIINHHTTSTSTKLHEIEDFFGNELTIEPLSKKRATKDLIINDEDFKAKLDPFSSFLSDEDKTLYEKYKPYYYASQSLQFNENFLGSSMFLFVYELLKKNSYSKEELLQPISDTKNGIWLHAPFCHSLFPCEDDIEEKIIALQKEILSLKDKLDLVG